MSSFNVRRTAGDFKAEKDLEYAAAKAQQNRADIEYVAMMTDVELEEEGGTADEQGV